MKLVELLKAFSLKIQQQEHAYFAGCIRPSYDSTIIHEIAHFQVSAPERRFEINFGLGDNKTQPSVLPDIDHVNEECRAILLHLYWVEALEEMDHVTPTIEKGLNLVFRYKGVEYEITSRIQEQNELTKNAEDWLFTKGLLDHNFRPTMLLNE